MNTPRLAITTVSAIFALNAAESVADDNVFVRGKDKFLEVTEAPKNVVKGVGKDIGFGFRDAWRRVSSFVTGKQPEPEFPEYQPAPYTPPPYGYTSPQGTRYAPGYGPAVQYDQNRYNPNSLARPVEGETPYVVPSPPLRRTSPNVQRAPQTPPAKAPVLTKPKTTPTISKPKPKPQPKVEPKKTVSTPVTPPTQPESTPSPPIDDQPQFAVPIPGKSGMVYSPFTKDKKPVDVRDIPAGTVVKDPYTNKLFRVP